MKKVISLLLAFSVVLSFAAVVTFAEEETLKKEFVIDGVLDPWYLTNDNTPADDLNTYHFEWFDPYVKGGAGTGSAPYDEIETAAEVFTAYDDNYVYFYVKVWDDELRFWNDFQPENYDIPDSSAGDSIEVWFDPDPASHVDIPVDPNGNGSEHFFTTSCRDPKQGDVQMRMQALYHPNTGKYYVNDFHAKYTNEAGEKVPLYKPGYVDSEGNPVDFGGWYGDNMAHFFFEDDPKVVDEYTGLTVSSGYGLEIRLPRNDDKTNSYRFNIAVNNSALYSDERYALALGAAWWISYNGAATVTFAEENPFFAQEIATDDPTDPSDPVDPSEPNDPVDPIEPSVNLGDINGDGKIDAKDALLALRISVGKYNPKDDEKIAADVNKDEAINAKDALEILKHSVGKPSVLDNK